MGFKRAARVASRAGSHAGRGFRYQDAVAANLAILGWANVAPYGVVIPEGDDDIELTTQTGRELAQVKSRREHRGPFQPAEVSAFLVALWKREANRAGDTYLLILEREVSGHPGEGGPVPLNRFAALVSMLVLTSADAVSQTRIWIMPNPRGAARKAIESVKGCTTLEADAYYGVVLRRAGSLADDNGMRGPGKYVGLSLSDVELELNRLGPVFTSTRLQAALSRGLCEAVDFSTPLEDSQFFAGVDVQPGHVVAGLLIERTSLRDAVSATLASRRNVLLKGPSGAGKSALQWDIAFALRHSVRWFRVRRLDAEDIADLVTLANSCCASAEAPVGFLLDNLGAGLTDGWTALAREVALQPGLWLLASIREEDVYTLEERSRAVEVTASADESFARQFWNELRERGQTDWTNWLEPWNQSKGLLLEYAHILTQGSRLDQTLSGQVAARANDPSRSLELKVLRLCSAVTSVGARVDTSKLSLVLGHRAAEAAATLPRLVNEHLLRDLGDGSLGGLHELRSTGILSATQAVSLDSEVMAFEQSLGVVLDADVGVFLSKALERHPAAEEAMLSFLATRLSQQPSARFATSVFNGLGDRQISQVIDTWLGSSEAAQCPVSLRSFAVMYGSAGVELPEVLATKPLAPAIQLLAHLKEQSVASNPRGRMLSKLGGADVEGLIENATDLASLNALLVALVGQRLEPKVREALLRIEPDLLHGGLAQVKNLLGSAAHLDRTIAQSWVARAGASELLARVGHEVPWATEAIVFDVPEGLAAASDIRIAPSRYQPDAHKEVVELCELLLALSPRADIAISRVVAPGGGVLGYNDIPVADKRIPRGNLPPAALPSWNRRWNAAIKAKLAPVSYGAYLREAKQAVDKLYPALIELFDDMFRGTVNQAALIQLGLVYDLAVAMPSPARPWIASGGVIVRESRSDSTLQSILHDCSTELLRRFNALPEEAAGYMAWTGGLIERIRTSVDQEPWALVGTGEVAPEALSKLGDLVIDLRSLAGESVVLGRHPSKVYRKSSALKGQALMQARQAVRKHEKEQTSNIERSLRKSFRQAFASAQVFVRPSAADMPVWPLVDVLVAFKLDAIHEWPGAVSAGWQQWRELVAPEYVLTAMPVVDGFAFSACGVGGLATAFPSQDVAKGWIEQAGLRAAPEETARLWNSFIDAVTAVATIESQGLGDSGRPELERVARADARARLESARLSLDGRVPDLMLSMASTLVALADKQPEALIGAQLSMLRNEMNEVLEILLNAQYACFAIDLGRMPTATS